MSSSPVAAATVTAPTLPKLTISDKAAIFRGLRNPEYFKEEVRPRLYRKCGNDPELVHELMLQSVHEKGKSTARILAPFFSPPKGLTVRINGQDILPFGTAAGMDKNGEGLDVFGAIFGFQEPGTVVLNHRDGNRPIRVAVLEDQLDMLNAQGFPSKGLEYFFENLSEYRKGGGTGRIYVSICGLPLSEDNAIQCASNEVELIATKLAPLVDGIVWNPFSPNTAALQRLRTPEIFFETANLISSIIPKKLLLVKLGPYAPEERAGTLKLVRKFIDGGGNGVVTTNTKMTPKDQLPETIRDKWGYASAGRSGAFLKEHRLKSISDMRMEFPEIVVFATGGIYTPEDAFTTFQAGANAIEGFTPYAYYGPGLVRNLMRGVSDLMVTHEYGDMEALQEAARAENGHLAVA